MKPETTNHDETTKSHADDAAKQAEVPSSEGVEQAAQERLAALCRGMCAERFVSPAKSPKKTQKEWSEFILSVAGSIPDPSFRRHDQGTFGGKGQVHFRR